MFLELCNQGLDSKMSHLMKHCLPLQLCSFPQQPSLGGNKIASINYRNQNNCALKNFTFQLAI